MDMPEPDWNEVNAASQTLPGLFARIHNSQVAWGRLSHLLVHIDSVINLHHALNVAEKRLQNLLEIKAWQASFDDEAPIPVFKSKELRPMLEMTAVD